MTNDPSLMHIETPDNNDRIDNLSEVIKAQIQATKDYSYAFVQILTTLEDIKTTITQNCSSNASLSRDIIIKLSEVSENMKVNQQIAKDRHDDFIDTLATYNEFTHDILEEIKNQNLQYIKQLPISTDIIKSELSNIIVQLQKNISISKQESDSILVELEPLININSNVNDLMHVKKLSKEWYNDIWDWFRKASVILAILWVILEGIIQCDIAKIQWFPVHPVTPVIQSPRQSPAVLPQVPLNVVAQSSSDGITISCEPQTGATYNIYTATKSGQETVAIYTGLTSPFQYILLPPGRRLYATMTTIINGVESSQSPEVTAVASK